MRLMRPISSQILLAFQYHHRAHVEAFGPVDCGHIAGAGFKAEQAWLISSATRFLQRAMAEPFTWYLTDHGFSCCIKRIDPILGDAGLELQKDCSDISDRSSS